MRIRVPLFQITSTVAPRAPASINFTMTLKSHRYTTRIAKGRSSTPFTRFKRCSLTETGRWKEMFFRDRKLEKRFARPEIKMPHMRTSVLQSLLRSLICV